MIAYAIVLAQNNPVERFANSLGMTLVRVPSGSFMMGKKDVGTYRKILKSDQNFILGKVNGRLGLKI